MAGRHRRAGGSSAEADAARPHLDPDECLWKCFDGRQTRGEQQSRQDGTAEHIIGDEDSASTPKSHGLVAGSVIWGYLGLAKLESGCGGWI